MKLENLQCLRKKLGVYFLYENKELVYIGYSGNMYVRILEHLVEGEKTFTHFKACECSNATFAEVLEVKLISLYTPKYNKLIVESFNTYFSTLPKICKEDMVNEKYVSIYGTNKISEISDFIIRDIKNTPSNCIASPGLGY